MAVFRPVSSAEHESEHSPPVLFPLGRKLIKLIKISRSQVHVWHLLGLTTAHAHKHPGAHTLLPSLYSATFKLLNTSDLLRHKPLVMAALPASLSARLFPFTLASTGVLRWMSTTDTCQSGLPIPLFTFRNKFNESERTMACVV